MMTKKFRSTSFLLAFCFVYSSITAIAQNAIPPAIMLRIVRAEDELRFDQDLQSLLKSPNPNIRRRAALAAGRIGNERAVPFLTVLLSQDPMAAFALGEIESVAGADAILQTLNNKDKYQPEIISRCLEAAGKIAAANPKDEKSMALGEGILDALEAEQASATRSKEIVLLGLTAALRAKPDEADFVVGKFLIDKDARVRADALNTLVRLRSKSANLKAQYRAMLLADDDAIVRANAARALGASEDVPSSGLLIEAATTDDDERVRGAAIRSLAALKDKDSVNATAKDKVVAAQLLDRGEKLFAAYKIAKAKYQNPAEKNELLEITTTLGRLLPNSNDERAISFLSEFGKSDEYLSPEIEVALARTSPIKFQSLRREPYDKVKNWQSFSAMAQGAGELASLNDSEENKRFKQTTAENLHFVLNKLFDLQTIEISKNNIELAIPDVLQAYDAFKPDALATILREYALGKQAIISATAAELLGKQPASEENIESLKKAFAQSIQTDKEMNDAQLAILSALVKLDKTQAIESLKLALDAPDFLVRRHAAMLIKQNDLTKDFPNVDAKVGTVKPYDSATKTKLGQILNTNADYVRAISRKNGFTKAILTTEKGTFAIDLLPEDAPLNVDNFIKLAKSGYFNGIAFHRVVPNFVVQGGDPRGDGNSGPGYQIRCEINMIPFERGVVGMALSGKDTGGSQWFVTHSPQPHLDGGYTVFGHVNEADMKIVDTIARGDKILTVKIVENISRKGAKAQRKK